MKVKALVNFSGAFSMCKGEVREIKDKTVLDDLLQAKYVEEVKQTPKRSDKVENKRSNNRKH